VPDRGPAKVVLGSEDELVVARAGVSGPAWARVWMPSLVPATSDPVMRVAPVTNSGELLGMIVVRRPDGAIPFDEDDDQALTELARQVGLALHNVKLDSALQESLDEVRRQADELRASRARIVEATDAERRRIERDLHDGAQQRLLAASYELRLASSAATAAADAPLAEHLTAATEHAQDALTELRELAHGIYPAILTEAGLHAALCSLATRAPLPVEIGDVVGGRYPTAVETAAYRVVASTLEAARRQSATYLAIRIEEADDDHLAIEVRADGVQLSVDVDLADRVGAVGGRLTVQAGVLEAEIPCGS
jgi:signal transduction histidine kinase